MQVNFRSVRRDPPARRAKPGGPEGRSKPPTLVAIEAWSSKLGPGRVLTKPEGLLHDLSYFVKNLQGTA